MTEPITSMAVPRLDKIRTPAQERNRAIVKKLEGLADPLANVALWVVAGPLLFFAWLCLLPFGIALPGFVMKWLGRGSRADILPGPLALPFWLPWRLTRPWHRKIEGAWLDFRNGVAEKFRDFKRSLFGPE